MDGFDASIADYDEERQRDLELVDISSLDGKTIESALVRHGHITLTTTDGFRFLFYGFVEKIPPGYKSAFDDPS
jgi:hypothetical protein